MRQRNKVRSSYDLRWAAAPAVAALAILLLHTSCGTSLQRSHRGYYFNHPLLNESWRPAQFQTTKNSSDNRTASAKSSPRNPGKRKGNLPPLEASPQQPLRGAVDEVARAEMVAAAARLVGIKNSFTHDSFLRHVLVVNNMVTHKVEAQGMVKALYKPGSSPTPAPSPGDILFLGEGAPEMAVVVESVDDMGTVTFIGVLGEEVGRGLLNPKRPTERKDAASGKALNTTLTGSKLAGECLLAVFGNTSETRPAN